MCFMVVFDVDNDGDITIEIQSALNEFYDLVRWADGACSFN